MGAAGQAAQELHLAWCSQNPQKPSNVLIASILAPCRQDQSETLFLFNGNGPNSPLNL